jgi:hypothetical protein
MADPSDPGQPSAQSPQVPLFYSNGFEINASLSDFGILFMYDGMPMMKVALSFTTTKTLLAQLQQGISAFEEATGQPLLTMEDVGRGYKGMQHAKSGN